MNYGNEIQVTDYIDINIAKQLCLMEYAQHRDKKKMKDFEIYVTDEVIGWRAHD